MYYKARPEISNITGVHKEPRSSSFPPGLPSVFFSAQLPLPGVFSLSPMTPPVRGYTVHIKTAATLLNDETTPHPSLDEMTFLSTHPLPLLTL